MAKSIKLECPMLSTFYPVVQEEHVLQMRHDNDRTLWGNFRGGSREALGLLCERHNTGMYRHGLFLCKDPDLVRDSVQELFSRLWSSRQRLSDADCVQSYLYSSLKRLLMLQIVRNRKRCIPLEIADEPEEPTIAEKTFIEKELRLEQIRRMRLVLELLTKNQREAILLRYFNGLTYIQIAEVMNLQVESVYNLVSKGIDQLRQQLQMMPVGAN